MNPTTPQEWILTAAEIRGLLAKGGVEPGLGSPFRRLLPEAGESVAASPSGDGGALTALQSIARPEVVFGAIMYPPEDAAYAWFYGQMKEPHLALLEEETERRFRVTWPVAREGLLETLVLSLQPDRASLSKEMALELDRPQLAALAAITDIMQEDALVAALNRLPAGRSYFSATSLLQSSYRSLEAADRRWMMQRLRLLLPVAVAPSLDEISLGLDGLLQGGLLALDGGRYTPSPAFGLLCSLLAVCDSCCALSARVRSGVREQGDWQHRHVAFWRSGGSLWLLDLHALEKTDFTATLRAVDHDRVLETLRSLLLPSEAGREPVIPLQQSKQEAPLKGMPPVETPLSAGTRAQTPSPLASSPPGPVPPEPPPVTTSPRTCAACGAVLRSGMLFCTKCGAPRSESPRP